MIFQNLESQFNISPVRMQADKLADRQGERIEHIGQVVILPALITIPNQAHEVSDLVAARNAHPDDGIKQAYLAASLEASRGDEVIELFKDKIAATKGQTRVDFHSFEQGANINFAIGSRLWQNIQIPSRLDAHIKQTVVAHRQATQGVQPTVGAILSIFIWGQNITGERCQRGHPLTDLDETVLQGSRVVFSPLGVRGLIVDGEAMLGACTLKTQVMLRLRLTFPSVQEAEQNTQIQIRQGQFEPVSLMLFEGFSLSLGYLANPLRLFGKVARPAREAKRFYPYEGFPNSLLADLFGVGDLCVLLYPLESERQTLLLIYMEICSLPAAHKHLSLHSWVVAFGWRPESILQPFFPFRYCLRLFQLCSVTIVAYPKVRLVKILR